MRGGHERTIFRQSTRMCFGHTARERINNIICDIVKTQWGKGWYSHVWEVHTAMFGPGDLCLTTFILIHRQKEEKKVHHIIEPPAALSASYRPSSWMFPEGGLGQTESKEQAVRDYIVWDDESFCHWRQYKEIFIPKFWLEKWEK